MDERLCHQDMKNLKIRKDEKNVVGAVRILCDILERVSYK